MRRTVPVMLGLAIAVSAASADVKVLTDVPSYIWYHGCGPTSAGMVIGHWDARGFDDLIPGPNDWNTNQQAVKDMIASPGHIRDYVPTPDRVATPQDPYHVDDCVADLVGCSRDPLDYGASFETLQYVGMTSYAGLRGYYGAVGRCRFYVSLTTAFFDEIDAGRPVELYVDSNADGAADHFVTAIGYDDTPGAERYACYNTYDHNVHWYGFARTQSGRAYGIRSGTLFKISWPGDANRDDKVDVFDLGILANHYNELGPWQFDDGDFNGDGAVDVFDLGILGNNYFHGTGAGDTADVQPVPEPAGVGLLGAGLLALVGGRRRRRVRL